jgi:hypothetical protein
MMTENRTYSFEEGLSEFYAGEVMGEAIYSALLEDADDPAERLKLAHLLQLETETKAWLRPHMVAVGLAIEEPMTLREKGLAIAQAQPASWTGKMQGLAQVIEAEFAALYRRYAEAARKRGHFEAAVICDFMVAHELAQVEFARRDLAGESLDRVLEPLRRYSKNPLPLPLNAGLVLGVAAAG